MPCVTQETIRDSFGVSWTLGRDEDGRLAHDTNVVFQSKDFAQTGAENRLRVSDDHADEAAVAVSFAFTRLPEVVFHGDRSACHQFSQSAQRRSNRYSSMTTPTPRRPSSSKLRTTRPRQSSCTSDVAPTTSAGSEMVKSTSEPTGISESNWNSTPLAEMFCVSVALAPAFDFTEIGSLIGKRGALCISG